MLDTFEILSTSGVVLWSKSYVPVGSSIIDSLIRDVFIEERIPGANKFGEDSESTQKPTYKREGYTLKWTTAKDFGLIFVVRAGVVAPRGFPCSLEVNARTDTQQAVYQSLVHLTWIDKLLDNVRALFTGLFGEQLKKQHGTKADFRRFDDVFEKQVAELESRADEPAATSASASEITPPSSSGVNNAPSLKGWLPRPVRRI